MKDFKLNKKNIKNYMREKVREYHSINPILRSQFKKMKKETLANVVRTELAVGGMTISRGFYCPSPIIDIVVGGCNRGKVLKRVTKRSKPSYEYGFDKDDRLILVRDPSGEIMEFIEYSENHSIGYGFTLEYEELVLEKIIECFYNDKGQIIRCVEAFGSYNHYEETHFEQYEYDENGLNMAYMASNQFGFFDLQYYIFNHNDEGYLSDYLSLSAKDHSNIKNLNLEEYTYKVYLKRKI